MNLDGTETLSDIRAALTNLAITKARTGNQTLRRTFDRQIDELLDAELRIKAKQQAI